MLAARPSVYATPHACPERARLFLSYSEALSRHLEVVGTYRLLYDRPEFENALAEGRKTLALCTAIRAALEEHTALHRCY